MSENLSKAQIGLLSVMADQQLSWSHIRQMSHPWTRGSLSCRGLIETVNHPYLDELWFITDAGRAALQSPSPRIEEGQSNV
jgi:hypothetical protein